MSDVESTAINSVSQGFGVGSEDQQLAVAFVAETLAGHLDPWILPRAVILADEVVHNTLVHARTGFVVTIEVEEDGCRVSVADRSPAVPVRRRPDEGLHAGGGTRLLERLSTSWGTELTPEGKVVWFEIRRQPVPETRSRSPKEVTK